METINLGFRKFEVSKQSKMVYMAFLVIFVSHLLSAFVTNMGPIGFLIYTIYLLAVGALTVYATNCIVVGQCITYAWIISYVYVVFAVIYVLSIIAMAWLKFKIGGSTMKEVMGKPSRKSRK